MSTPSLLDEIERGPEQIEQMSFDQLISAGLESTHIETGVEAVRESPPPRRLEAPVTGRHQDVCLYLTMLLKSFVEVTDAGLVRDAPFEVRLNDTQVYEPDIVFLANANFDRIHETYIEGPPDIVIEVLTVDSTALDRGEKFAAYEAAGVREYWIVDPVREIVDLYHLGSDGYYDEFRPDIAGRLRSRVLRGLMLHTDLLWQRVLPRMTEIVEMVQAMVVQR